MTVSIQVGVRYEGLGLLYRGSGLIFGRFRGDPYKNYLALSLNLDILCVGVLLIRTLLFGVCIKVPKDQKGSVLDSPLSWALEPESKILMPM